MKKSSQKGSTAGNAKHEYELLLYITGASPNSLRAVENIERICAERLAGNFSLEIIDVYQDTHRAKIEQLIALPMLVKKSPSPETKLIGDLSDTTKVLTGLGLK